VTVAVEWAAEDGKKRRVGPKKTSQNTMNEDLKETGLDFDAKSVAGNRTKRRTVAAQYSRWNRRL